MKPFPGAEQRPAETPKGLGFGFSESPRHFGISDPLPKVPVCDVELLPLMDVQAKIDASPKGTSFCFAPGTHQVSSLRPKNGDSFLGQLNAVLTGGDSAKYAFKSSASNVTVAGLVIERFNSPLQQGAVHIEGSGWTVRDNEIRNNAAAGVYWRGRNRILRNNIHHNGQEGYACTRSTGALFEGNVVAYNNTRKIDPGWEAGGGKCSETDHLTLRNNYTHDNRGPGMWTDINNIHTLYEGNRVENNKGFGIFHEISYDAVIRNNTASGNGDSWGWMGRSGIFVANSSGVEIYGNTLADNGIAAVQQKRGSGSHGPWILRNLHVYSNRVAATGGHTGIGQDVGDPGVFAGSNWFQRNTYRTPKGCRCWAWADRTLDARGWRSYGQDTKGKFSFT